MGRVWNRPVYVLELAARPEADVDYPTGKLWVDKEELLPLRTEFLNDAGELEKLMEILALGYFEEDLIPEQIQTQNLLDGSATTISVLERHREELPDTLFVSENLAAFDPAEYGF